MILIRKRQDNALPETYQDWLSENQTALSELSTDPRTTHTLWEMLGKKLTGEQETLINPIDVRYALQCSLYEEQGGICCYCGQRLRRDWNKNDEKWIFANQSIEHFKSKSQYKTLMFHYENLMLCCKNSSGFSKIRIGDKYKGAIVKHWDDVALASEIPAEKIMNYRPNQHLKKNNELRNGHVIHIPNPTHCDDEKSKYDRKPDLIIINPTQDTHLIEKMTYNSGGGIDIFNANADEESIIQTTIKVLALRIDKLTDKRKDVWRKTDKKVFEEKYADSFAALNNANISNEKRREVTKKLIEKILEPDDSDGLLSPFCFVEYASLKSQFISIFR